MRTFAIVLGCLAWALSCFIAVSYYRAGAEQQVVEARLKNATAAASSVTAWAGQDGASLSERLKRDQGTVANDQASLDRDHQQQLGDAQDRQTLTADQATLQADRMMQYTVENFSRTDPNPQVVAAMNRVDLDRRFLAEIVATKKRDLKLSRVLIGIWLLVASVAFAAFHGIAGGRPTEQAQQAQEEDRGNAESELPAAEDNNS